MIFPTTHLCSTRVSRTFSICGSKPQLEVTNEELPSVLEMAFL